jgi:hypothetical protein
MDTMFFAQHLSPAFEDALAFTGQAFDEFLRRGRRDNFKLVVLADKSMYRYGGLPLGAKNPLSKTGQYDRLEGLTRARGIPLIDLYQHIVSLDEDPLKASFSRDGHWSPQGHRWAAEALNSFFKTHPEICARQEASR